MRATAKVRLAPSLGMSLGGFLSAFSSLDIIACTCHEVKPSDLQRHKLNSIYLTTSCCLHLADQGLELLAAEEHRIENLCSTVRSKVSG